MAHICWVIRDLRGGGAERSVIGTANGLCERGHRVDLVLFFPANEQPQDVSEHVSIFVLSRRPTRWNRIRRRAANLIRKKRKRYRPAWNPQRVEWFARRLPFSRLLALAFRLAKEHRWPFQDMMRRQRRADYVRALRLARYLDECKPDIVFTNLWQADLAGFLASRIIRNHPPIIPVARCAVEEEQADDLNFVRQVFQSAVHVVAVSGGVERNFVETVGVSQHRITTVYNPVVKPELCELAKAEPDHPWFGDSGSPIVLGAGRLAPQKDFPTLIEAFRRVRTERRCRLVILGEGPSRRELENRVRVLGLEEDVSLPGWAMNPWAYMARAGLFVLSSRHEGLPGALVEALACGCPAVSTDCPSGPAEILEDPALLAPVGDPDALAGVMLRALARPADRAAFRAKAMRFSLDRAVDGYERVIAESLANRVQDRRGRMHEAGG